MKLFVAVAKIFSELLYRSAFIPRTVMISELDALLVAHESDDVDQPAMLNWIMLNIRLVVLRYS